MYVQIPLGSTRHDTLSILDQEKVSSCRVFNSHAVLNVSKDTSNVSRRVARNALTRWRHWSH